MATPLPVAVNDLVETDYLNGVTRPLYYRKLTVAEASFDITPITGIYAHLELRLQLRGTAAATSVEARVRFNNDSGANYDWILSATRVSGVTTGEALAATSIKAGGAAASTAPASAADSLRISIENYASTSFQKSMLAEGSQKDAATTTNIFSLQAAGWWRSTAAITRVTVLPSSGSWDIGSVVALYGYGVV